MSLGGYALLFYGGTWGGLATTIFVVGAGLVLVILLFSSTLRARFKVFLSKHFFHNKYDYREEWLRLIAALSDFEDRSTRQVVIKALAQIVGSPSGLLWVLADKEQAYRLAATYHAPDAAPDIPLDDPLIAFMKEQEWLIDLQEYALEPKHYGDLALPDWLADFAEAWLIVPLVTRHELVGLIMLTEAPGPPKLNYEDRDLLKTAGNHIAVHLAQEKSDNLLAEAQQFEAYNRLTAFLMHDLNNLIAQQSLIVENAEKHKRNPDFVDDAIETIAGSVERMKRVMRQLKRDETERRDESDRTTVYGLGGCRQLLAEKTRYRHSTSTASTRRSPWMRSSSRWCSPTCCGMPRTPRRPMGLLKSPCEKKKVEQ